MIVLIAGATHTGKTALAQRLLEKYRYPYLSIDHLKMGLIRSGQTQLTPEDDRELAAYLWPIVREMVKTAIENHQNLVVEGCYIPFDWQADFEGTYLQEIRYTCLVMTRQYIETHWEEIFRFGNVIEARQKDSLNKEALIGENEENFRQCREKELGYILIDESYQVDLELEFWEKPANLGRAYGGAEKNP